MALAYSAIAAVTTVMFWIILGGNGFPPAFVIPGVAFYPFSALAMCLIAAANEQRGSRSASSRTRSVTGVVSRPRCTDG